MYKRPLLATLLTTGGLALLLSFKTPTAGSAGVPANSGSGNGSGGNGAAVQTAGTAGSYSGQLTGSAVQMPFGIVQVQVTLQNGTITDVQTIQLPGGGHTGEVSSYSAPRLRSEVLRAQSAQIDTISGATYTSEAYIQSLQSALSQIQ
jgi:uncharacterized protein with FMN-binding domain